MLKFLFFLLLALPASAQRLAWKVEVPNVEAVEWVTADGTGGACALIRKTGGSHKILWLTNKGQKRAEFDIEAPLAASLTGPLLLAGSRFYVLIENGDDVKLRRYTVSKKGEVTFLDTQLEDQDRIGLELSLGADRFGFFVSSRDLGDGGTGHITRYTH